MGDGDPATAPPETPAAQPQQRQNDEEEAAASPRSTAEAEAAPAADPMAAPSVRASSQEAAAPAPASSDPEARAQPERVGSLVLRPLAQRLGGGGASAQPPADAAGGGLPMSPSGSLAEPGTGQPIGWAPRKSAWLPYRPSPGSVPTPQHGGEPPASCAPESPAAAGRGATAASSSSSPGPQQQPAKLQPPVSLPVQNSLDILHEAAVSAAEGFLRLDSEPQALPSLPMPEEAPQEREAWPSTDADEEPGHQFFTGA